MVFLPDFPDGLEFPDIPEGPGVCIIEDGRGRVLQVGASNNVRRFIGEMFDSRGTLSPHGPKIYDAQRAGERIVVRWKLTPGYKAEKRRLMGRLNPNWAEP